MTTQEEIEQRRRAFTRLLKLYDIQADELAKRANISAATIHAYILGDIDSLNRQIESAIAKALRLSETDIYDRREPAIVDPIYVPVVGQVQAGAWMESSDYESIETIPMTPDPRFQALRHFALKVLGPSMNQIIPSGGYALCVDTTNNSLTPANGQVVVAQRQREKLEEKTLKQVRIGDDGTITLCPRSDDPRFQQEIHLQDLPDQDSAGTITDIVALVVGRYRSLI